MPQGATLRRLDFLRFGCLLIAFCVAAIADERPETTVLINLTSVVGTPGADSSVAFLTDELLLISNGDSSPISVLYDIKAKKVVRTGTTCATTGRSLWATPGKNLLAACPNGLVLYNLEFQPIAHFAAPLTYNQNETLLFSPTREFIAVNPLPRRGNAKVLTTDTLTVVASYPSESDYVTNLYRAGYLVYASTKGKKGWELSFYQFPDLQPQLLFKSSQNCATVGFGISESEFLKPHWGKDQGEIIDVTSGQVMLKPFDIGSPQFVQTTVSGKRFALGFQQYSKAHIVKQLVNPLTYIEALGTCCDDPSNLFRVRVYDQQSGHMLAEFHWKTRKNEPLWDSHGNSAVALSPRGGYLAFLRATAVEVYRIPDEPLH